MTAPTYGFIGLGNMGRPICANLAAAGFAPLTFDQAGTDARSPDGSQPVASVEEVFAADTIFICVPDGNASASIGATLSNATNRITHTIIDLSTTGIQAAQQIGKQLASHSIDYIDSPVSGGVAGARKGTMTLIWSGSAQQLERHRPALEAISGNLFHVGQLPGQGQTMKLLNNFLSATAMAATSEAILFGLGQGLDMEMMLDVVNVSTGQNTATADKFPNRIQTGTFDSGFFTALMRKDVALYLASVKQAGTPAQVGTRIEEIWAALDRARPGSDMTEIFSWLGDEMKARE